MSKKYKPEPPKPLKETAIIRHKIDVIKANIETVLEQVKGMRDEVDKLEEHYKEVLSNPVKPEPPPESGSDEVDAAFDELMKS